VLSKAIGGSLPLAVIVYRETLDSWQPGAHAGTFRGNQLAMAAGIATIRHIRAEALHVRAESLGRRLAQLLSELQAAYPQIGDVRTRGLMAGIEVIDPTGACNALGHPAAHPELARRIQLECLKRGLIVELGGRHGSVVRLLPPLIVTGTQIAQIAQILEVALHVATV
jgi:diaminobutyrate-2-oxoglutarate transaminase